MSKAQTPTPAPNAKFASPVPIIGPRYCVPYEVNLSIVRKVLNVTSGNFEVTDVDGKIIFKVHEKFLSVHGHRVLFDGDGNPVVTIRKKVRNLDNFAINMTYVLYIPYVT
jgi:hypothetical protein